MRTEAGNSDMLCQFWHNGNNDGGNARIAPVQVWCNDGTIAEIDESHARADEGFSFT
jgi:hypothetical protein